MTLSTLNLKHVKYLQSSIALMNQNKRKSIEEKIFSFSICALLAILFLFFMDLFELWNILIEYWKVSMLLAILFSIALLSHYELWIDFTYPNLRNYDLSIFAIFIILFIYRLTFNIDEETTDVIVIMISLFFTILIIRSIVIIAHSNKQSDSKLLSISDFLSDEFTKKSLENYGSRLIFKDNSKLRMKDDLFNHNNLVKGLVKFIESSTYYEQSIVGVVGPWGSGKTTIYYMAKSEMDSNKNYCFIYFDSWDYSDENSLLMGLFDSISKNLPFASKLKISAIRGDIRKTLVESGNPYVSIIGSLCKTHENIFDEFRNEINSYLKLSGKRLFITIDNLDRADKAEIIAVFRLINGIYAFSNTTFILLYDDSKIKEIDGTSGSIDKLVQSRFTVPELTTDKLIELMKKCNDKMISLDMSYKLSPDAMHALSKIIETPRDIIYLLNIFSNFDNKLFNFDDYICLNFIYYKNNQLYYKISKNRNEFVVDSRQRLMACMYKASKIDQQHEEDIFKIDKSEKYSEVLSILSPLMSNTEKSEIYCKLPEKRRAFSSVLYINTYFTYTESSATLADEKFDFVQNKLNSSQEIYFKDIRVKDESLQNILLTMLERLEFQDNNQKIEFSELLLKSVKYQFLESEKINGILGRIIDDMSIEDTKTLLNLESTDYDLLGVLNILCRYIRSEDKKEIIKSFIEEKSHTILKDCIDIYEDPNYNHGNVWAIWRSINPDTDLEKFRKYIKNCIGSDTHKKIRAIYDSFELSFSDTKGLAVGPNALNILFDIKNVQEIITDIDREKLNNEEKMVYDTCNYSEPYPESMPCDHFPNLRNKSQTSLL